MSDTPLSEVQIVTLKKLAIENLYFDYDEQDAPEFDVCQSLAKAGYCSIVAIGPHCSFKITQEGKDALSQL
ncbi:MAG: hypothetical protein AAFV33_00545 [Chloroflexota bacterium]